MLEPHTKLTCDQRCSRPFKASSGCTVATKEVMLEAELAIHTFQAHHEAAMVYAIVDRETKLYLQERKFAGPLLLLERELEVPSTVKKHNDYHRADAILWKMEVFEIAVKQSGDSVFFDCDIIFLAPLYGPEDCEVALSHNLAVSPNTDKNGESYGFFNAGLVWTCNPKYPRWWKNQYLSGEGFYEQAGMNMSPRMFRCGYFDQRHNYGYWRGPLGRRTVGSVHLHMGTTLDKTMPQFMLSASRKLRKEVWTRLKNQDIKLASAARRVLGQPDRMFFVHFGKAGGVYVNNVLQEQILVDFKMYDSWTQNLKRDWTSEELKAIISTPDRSNNLYLHEHHVNVQTEHILLAKEYGWKTFTFVRNPMELIPSLYYWRLKKFAETGENRLTGVPLPMDAPFEEFWHYVVQEAAYLWAMPAYVELLDYVAGFSDENLAQMTIKWFGYAHEIKDRMNASGNPGFEQLRAEKTITDEMLAELTARPEFQRFTEILERKEKLNAAEAVTSVN